MDSNPLDALIADGAALVDGTVVGTNADWIALAKRQHAALKAAHKETDKLAKYSHLNTDGPCHCSECLSKRRAGQQLQVAMQAAAEVQP